MKNSDKKKENKVYLSTVVTDSILYEMIYDSNNGKTRFVSLQQDTINYIDKLPPNIYPIQPTNGFLRNNVVLLPSDVSEYESEAALLKDIKDFIHKYVQISERFEELTPYYILLTWFYDQFSELPYIRAIGDYGCGKSRFIKVLGSISYKPMFTMGASTVAPLFRVIEQFRGTLVLDEADLKYSDTNSEMVKILNNGFQKGFPVLRCSNSKNNHEVEAFNVFCPKIVATRNKFKDQALESRFLVEYMSDELTRNDIPINLDKNFEEEALELRNKLLLWRLRNYDRKIDLNNIQHDRSIETRLSQIVAPLSMVIQDEESKVKLKEMMREYDKELKIDRGHSFYAPILDVLIMLMKEGRDVRMGDIAGDYNMTLPRGEKELSGRKIGQIVRRTFGIKTIRKSVGYIVDVQSYNKRIAKLRKKYNFPEEDEQMNEVNFSQGDEILDQL